MAELKTQKTKISPSAFIAGLKDEQRKKDSKTLFKIFKEVTGLKPAMWGASIVGFGSYHYKSERSAQEGDWPRTGFSPRKQNMTIYFMPGFKKFKAELKKIGKHKTSVSCLYFNKLEDLDQNILKKMIKASVMEMEKRYPST